MSRQYQWYDEVTMTVDARSLQVPVPETFDFNSQAGILFLLRAIRLAPIEQAHKNTLKDLVFLYNTGSKDVSLQQKLEQTLLDFGVTPAVVEQDAAKAVASVAAPEAPASGFSSGRLAPVFISSTVVPIKIVAPAIPEISPQNTTPIAVPVPPTPVKVETSIPIRKITPSIPQPPAIAVTQVVKPRIVTVSVPTVAPVVEADPINVVVPVKSSEPIPVAVPVEASAIVLTPVVVNDATVRMERIRTIKSTVNDRIGNPVNLVDVDNGLGREYMSSLLEAMKLLSSASVEESNKAMSRLETVYTQVLMLLDTIDEQKQAIAKPVASILTPVPVAAAIISPITPVIPVMTPVPTPIVATEPSQVERITPVARIIPTTPEVSQTTTPDFEIRSKVVDKPQTVAASVSGWGASETIDLIQPVSVREEITSVAARITPPDQTTVNRLSTPPALPLRQVLENNVPSYQPEAVQSVTEQAAPLRSLSELKTADEVSAIEAMQNNPLYTKDVDAGLEQLLGEWSIFKKSGLFGTGPKGREHPLYVKINAMHLPLILAGRFEGSTQEIKQSITDYMNGWRYEQGIVYDQGETLDQYLRRVIRHIIDLQKSKRRP